MVSIKCEWKVAEIHLGKALSYSGEMKYLYFQSEQQNTMSDGSALALSMGNISVRMLSLPGMLWTASAVQAIGAGIWKLLPRVLCLRGLNTVGGI